MAKHDKTGILPQDGNPAALTPAVMTAIARKVSPERIADCIAMLLEAELSNGQPDVRAIESGIKLYLNYMVGMPVQRQEIVTHKVTSSIDPKSLLANPATLDAIVRQLEGSEAGDTLLKRLRDAKGKTIDAPSQ